MSSNDSFNKAADVRVKIMFFILIVNVKPSESLNLIPRY